MLAGEKGGKVNSGHFDPLLLGQAEASLFDQHHRSFTLYGPQFAPFHELIDDFTADPKVSCGFANLQQRCRYIFILLRGH
jgi:hypothetical protein